MAARVVEFDEYKNLVGEELGASDWHEVTQDEVNIFADATHDHQWIHCDPERAKAESPFGGPIAHGYYTLSHIPHLLSDIIEVNGVTMGVNYGLNKVRFPAPVPVGARIRAHAELAGMEEIAGGYQGVVQVTVEAEGSEKPSCVAECVFRYYA